MRVKLGEILNLLKFQSDDTVFKVSEEDKMAIKNGRKQIKNGETLTGEEVDGALKEWLEE